MAAVTFNGILMALMVTFLLFATYKLCLPDALDDEIRDTIQENYGKSFGNKVWSLLFVKSLDSLTPQFELFKVPIVDKSYFMIGKYPWINWFQMWVFTALASVFAIFQFLKGEDRFDAFASIGILLLLIPVSYVIGNFIAYAIYYISSMSIGLTKAQATELIESMNAGIKGVVTPMLYTSIFSVIYIFRTFYNSIHDD